MCHPQIRYQGGASRIMSLFAFASRALEKKIQRFSMVSLAINLRRNLNATAVLQCQNIDATRNVLALEFVGFVAPCGRRWKLKQPGCITNKNAATVLE